MNIENIWQRIQDLPKLHYLISKGDIKAIQELKDLYRDALGRTMKRECISCRLRAYSEITNLTYQNLYDMANKTYSLKNKNSVIYFGHAHYTNDTLTDDVVKKMVASNPATAALFEPTPEVEEKAKKAGKKDKSEPTPEVEESDNTEDSGEATE